MGWYSTKIQAKIVGCKKHWTRKDKNKDCEKNAKKATSRNKVKAGYFDMAYCAGPFGISRGVD